MNTIHDNGENDKSLNEDLDMLGRSYAGLEQDEPPDLLDQAILNSAHRAVEKKSRWIRFGWVHGLTTAAVFVLALSLIINQREHAPALPDGIEREDLAPSQLEFRAKKQAPEVKSDDFRQLSKEKNVGRSEKPATVPTTAMDDAASNEVSPDSSGILQESTFASQALQAEPATDNEADKDRAQKSEEVMMQELTPETAREEKILVDELRHATAAAASPPIEAVPESPTDPKIEQQLLEIIQLKQNGDQRWKKELETFIEKHPDYPLPDELKN